MPLGERVWRHDMWYENYGFRSYGGFRDISAVLAGEVLFGNFSGITVSWFRLGLSLGYFTKLYAAVYFSYIEKLYLITMK